MGDDGGEKDQRCGAQAQRSVFPHRHQYKIGAPVPLHPAHPIEQHNAHSPHREEEQQRRVQGAGVCGPVKGVVKGGAHPAHHHTDTGGKQEPFEKNPRLGQTGQNGVPCRIQNIHLVSLGAHGAIIA